MQSLFKDKYYSALLRYVQTDFYTITMSCQIYFQKSQTSDNSDVIAHAVFCHKRASNFFGRSDLLEAGLTYFHQSDAHRKPLVVHGISGAGKTSLVSALAVKSREYFKQEGHEPVLAVRY